MTIKEMIQHAYDDLVSLKVNWFNGIMLALIVLVVSSITTPFIGCLLYTSPSPRDRG